MNTSDGLNSLFINDESDSGISAFEYPSPKPNNEVLSSIKGFHLNINRQYKIRKNRFNYAQVFLKTNNIPMNFFCWNKDLILHKKKTLIVKNNKDGKHAYSRACKKKMMMKSML